MKHLVKTLGPIAFAFFFFQCAPVAFGQLSEWDNGVPKDLFKEEQTKDKKPKPIRRLAPAPPNCPECQDAVKKLQAALDDWYALQYEDGKTKLDDSKQGKPVPGNPKQQDLRDQMADAMAGLGQKVKNPPKGKDQASVKKQIKAALEELQQCLKKCKPPEDGAPSEDGAKPPSDPGAGQPADGPATGEKIVPPPAGCDLQAPKLPECFDNEREREKYRENLEKIQQKLRDCKKAYAMQGAGVPANHPLYKPWQTFKQTVEKALEQTNQQNLPGDDGKDAIDKVPLCKPKTKTGGGAMVPKQIREEFCALIEEDKIDIDFTGTGETCGHVADAMITNLTDQPLSCTVPPMILESISGKNQDYACPETKKVDVGPKTSKTVPIEGVCLVRNKPPVAKNVTGDLRINACDDDSRISDGNADKFMTIATSIFQAAEELLDDGSLKEIPYNDPEKKKDIVVQWATWMDPRISQMAGAPPATKEDLKKVVYKQAEENGPLTSSARKKVDEGINTIFEKIELTTKKAKDLEQSATPEEGASPQPGQTTTPRPEEAKTGASEAGISAPSNAITKYPLTRELVGG